MPDCHGGHPISEGFRSPAKASQLSTGHRRTGLRFDFKRHRQSVAAFVQRIFPTSSASPNPAQSPPPLGTRRRANSGSTIPPSTKVAGPDKQTLLLTVDDHSRKLLVSLCPSDTTWNHFEHFRDLSPARLPLVVYTDGLSLFGHDSMPMTGIPVRSFNAPSPPWVWPIGSLPARRPKAKSNAALDSATALGSAAGLRTRCDYAAAQVVLDRQIAHQNATSAAPRLQPKRRLGQGLAEQRTAMRPCPPAALLNLHLALHLRRRVNADYQIDFLGRSWPIAPTKRSTVALIHHPLRQFWAVTQPPSPPLNT